MIDKLSSIAKNVGRKLIEWRSAGITGGKWDGGQFKAKADLLAHEMLFEQLSHIPSHIPIISEEDPTSFVNVRPKKYWIIDPIDGTASYAHGYSGFVTQIALVENDIPQLSVVYAPVFDILYTAERGKGAFINGKRLCCSQDVVMKTLIDNYPEPRGLAKSTYHALNFTHYVECGSISLKICKIAEGAADLFVKDVLVRDWDLAPPHLIIEEAGGFLSDVSGKKIEYIGNYNHNGLIAAPSDMMATLFISWFLNKNER